MAVVDFQSVPNLDDLPRRWEALAKRLGHARKASRMRTKRELTKCEEALLAPETSRAFRALNCVRRALMMSFSEKPP